MDNKLTIPLSGRIDSSNSSQIEEELKSQIEGNPDVELVLDMENLEYISSAGLRVLLRLLKSCHSLSLIGVQPDVYEILDMTGFTEMMPVEKAYRRVSIEGCEKIGEGANGTVYRINNDNVVKVYNNANALEEIKNERELARLALVLGIPTAISYDVAKVGDSYGSVFELLNARSFSEILTSQPEKYDWCVKEYVDLLKKIHGTEVPEGKLPDMRQRAISWAQFMLDYLPPEVGQKILRMIEEVPPNNHMVHGDYHTKNVELTDGEVLLIDMDTLGVGDPIFEFAAMFNSYVGFLEANTDDTPSVIGVKRETAGKFWRSALAAYFETDDEERINEIERKASVIGYTRLMRRSIRRVGLESEEERKNYERWKKHLLEALEKTDSLMLYGNEITLDAKTYNLNKVMNFIGKELKEAGCPMKTLMQIETAVEEIFINIASYAYTPGSGKASIHVVTEHSPKAAVITFKDQGRPYDPLGRQGPDVTLPAEKRQIGGLGIFMVRKIMDDVQYEYKDGSNVFTMKKFF